MTCVPQTTTTRLALATANKALLRVSFESCIDGTEVEVLGDDAGSADIGTLVVRRMPAPSEGAGGRLA